MQSLYPSCPCWGGEENGKEKAKHLCQDKDSLTEKQRKQIVTTIILIRRIYKTNRILRATVSHHRCAAQPPQRLLSPLPPTKHDATWH